MAEVGGHHLRRRPPFQDQRQVARARAQVEYSAAGPGKDTFELSRRDPAPVVIRSEREQVIEKIITVSDASEHSSDPFRRFLSFFGRLGRVVGG